MRWNFSFYKSFVYLLFIGVTLLAYPNSSKAQTGNPPNCKIEDGNMIISVPMPYDSAQVDSLIRHFDLQDIGLIESLHSGNWSKSEQGGWIYKINKKSIELLKPIVEMNGLDEMLKYLMTSSIQDSMFSGIPVMIKKYGVNNYKKKDFQPVENADGTSLFQLEGFQKASSVFISGSFNNWSLSGSPLSKSNSGWQISIPLKSGKHLYKFIVDGRWMEDPNNKVTENDGFDGKNSVCYKSNYKFKLAGNTEARRVILAGSFNSWDEREIEMNRVEDGWELPIYLEDGTYLYKFIIDGNWINDSTNPRKVDDSNGGFNSVISIGTPYLFRLKGYTNAQRVMLSGDFNNWNPDELALSKTDSGWVLPYVLKAGNYSYKFIVDNVWILDPNNELVSKDNTGNANSLLILGANQTFTLKDYLNAKEVILSGDFNSWDTSNLKMKKTEQGWTFSIYLSPGKHLYKYIVDGTWINDPGNPIWEENEVGTGNSVIWQLP